LSIAFDKLALVKRLEQGALFSREQAETLAEGLHTAVHENLVSKVDLQETENRLTSQISGVRSDMMAMEGSLRSDMGSLRSDMKTLEGSLRSDMKTLEGSLRSDMMAMEGSLRSDMSSLRSDMSSLRSDMKALEGSLRSELRVQEHSLKLWMGTIVVGSVSALGGLMTFLVRFYH
jgi:hypothetical protein